MARLGWGSGQFKWSAGSPQKQNKKPAAFMLLDCTPPPQKKKQAHTPNPQSSIADTTLVHPSPAHQKQRALQPGRIVRALPWRLFVHTYNSTIPLLSPPPPPPPVTLSRFPHHPQPGAEDDSEGGGVCVKESLPLEQRLWEGEGEYC